MAEKKEKKAIELVNERGARQYDDVQRKSIKHADNVWRLVKDPSDRLNVKMTIEITGSIRRGDLDRFTQAMAKTAAFEFEDGCG